MTKTKSNCLKVLRNSCTSPYLFRICSFFKPYISHFINGSNRPTDGMTDHDDTQLTGQARVAASISPLFCEARSCPRLHS